MFERYTERARRVIFFARYEASLFGSTTIETEHFLLGIFREDEELALRFLDSADSIKDIRRAVEERSSSREKVSTTIDLPLSNECKRILAYAAEEAEGLNHSHIGTEHLLLGMIREENTMACQILRTRGIDSSAIRQRIANQGRRFPIWSPDLLPIAGCVPDADTAIRIAESVWIPLWGVEAVKAQKPFRADLTDEIWTVRGSPPGDQTTRPMVAMIKKTDCSILRLGQERPE
jgi:hypothetical protein